MNLRGKAMGVEHRGKGIDMQLGPVAGPLGRVPAGGRNWEGKFVCLKILGTAGASSYAYVGFSPDPVLTGVAMKETIEGIQDAGVIACAKHFIMNEQERYRDSTSTTKFASSSNLDDKTMHELYLW